MTTEKVYVIYDTVAEKAGPLLEAPNDQVALRHFMQVLKSAYTPGDYQLWCVGTRINHVNGMPEITSCVHELVPLPLPPKGDSELFQQEDKK